MSLTIVMIESSESVRSMVRWSIADRYHLIECSSWKTFEDALANGVSPSIVLINFTILKAVQDQYGSALEQKLGMVPSTIVLVDAAEFNQVSSFKLSYSLDYLVMPFDPMGVVMRIEKNKPKWKIRVLACDHSQTLSAVHRKELLKEGILVTSVSTDREFESKLKDAAPDVVMMDGNLPPLNRDTLIENVRKYNDSIRIMAMMDSQMPESAWQNIIGLIDEFVLKPVTLNELAFRIKQLVDPETPKAMSSFKPDVTPIEVKQPPIEQKNEEPVHDTSGGWSALPLINDVSEGLQDIQLLKQVYIMLNHEIRSPLTSILIGSQALERRLGHEEQTVAKEISESAKRIRDSMNKLVTASAVSSEEYVNGTTMAKLSGGMEQLTLL